MIFLDTSCVYALADVNDSNHDEALNAFEAARETGQRILTSSYVVVESAALLQKRLGRQNALSFLREAAEFEIIWVTDEIHIEAVNRLGQPGPANLSFVDVVSFIVMRLQGIEQYLGFDGHFEAEGFRRAGME